MENSLQGFATVVSWDWFHFSSLNISFETMREDADSMRRKPQNHAASEIVGTIVLLAMAISLFTILNMIVFSYPMSNTPPAADIVSTVDTTRNLIILEHNRGSPLDLDTKVLFNINGSIEEIVIGDSLHNYLNQESRADGVWNSGETVVYTPSQSILRKKIEVMVVDPSSQAIIMIGMHNT
jgi:flagellin-like protein